jgi:hypothetical protein
VSFLTVLPLAFVMIAGPQIITAILLATGRDARRNSLDAGVDGQAADRRCRVLIPAGPAAGPGHANRHHHDVHRGASLTRHGRPWWHSMPLVLVTLLLVSLPLIDLLLGKRAEHLLPKVRDWMTNTLG